MCDPFGDREIGLDSIIRRSATRGYQCMTPLGSATAYAQALMGLHLDVYAGNHAAKVLLFPDIRKCFMLFAQISLVYLAFAIDHPQKSGTSVDMLCCSQTPRRSDTSADMLCCSQTPQRGDTLVTAGRRPADTANLPTNSVPGGVAHHSSVSQHPLVRLDAKLPQQSLVFICMQFY